MRGRGRRGWRERSPYAVDLYEEETVERMVEYWRMVLEEMVWEAPGSRRMGDLSLLRGAEREQIVEGWNRTERGVWAGVGAPVV